MDGLIQPGQALRMGQGGGLVIVENRIAEGGQGVVHQARLGGVPLTVKWFRQGPGSDEMRKSITALIQRKPSHRAFVWPIDLVSSDSVPGFGYVMPLLEPRFTSLASMLNLETQPSFRVVAAIGRELVDAFAALHSSGLCYRDISFGNLRADQEAGEVAIIDIDNVGVDGEPTGVKGTGLFMAPEILRDEAFPSTATDLHSLAVLLFYLLMHGHPLLGVQTDAPDTWEDGPVRDFGVDPLFIFDPDDHSNRPPPGDSVAAWWPIYPQQCRRVFTQAFTKGLHDASPYGRVHEGTWRRILLCLHDCVSTCASCRAPVYYDLEQTGQHCWQCGGILPAPPTLRVPGGTLVLSDGAIVSRHHLYRDRDYRSACATVEPHPGQPTRVILRNQTDMTWTVVPDGEEPRRVAPSQRLAARPMQIDFGEVQGRIL
jgi:eukaryotic-like serine/threonine-protein kinase